MNLTFNEYYQVITAFSINEVIIYYFVAYLFIMLTQTILKTEIETDNRFRTNPKILLSLSLIYVINFIYAITDKVSNLTIFENLVITFSVFFIALYIIINFFHKILFRNIYKIYTKKRKNIYKLCEYYNNDPKNKERQLKLEINENKVSTYTKKVSEEFREINNIFLTDLTVIIITCSHLIQLNLVSGLAIIFISILHIIRQFKLIQKSLTHIINTGLGTFTKNI